MYFGSQEYVGIKNSKLMELSDDCLVLAVISWMYGICDINLEQEYKLILQLYEPCQYIYGAVLADDDIVNGGFAQYYANKAEFAKMAAIGFNAIGAYKKSEIMIKANEVYEKHSTLIADGSVRNNYDILRKINGFEVLNNEYYSSCKSETFQKLCVKYIRENIDCFGEQS